ncbi:MAG TPA: LysR family transcriptional regulator [Sphingobium sp.]|nr:LysR family transcriptional regulator [Sphingobium sp.]
MDVGQPSIDHLRIFLAVVDEGSFNRAARRLGRAVSVISYGIHNLEAQLGVTLFAREGSRRPTLTAAGKALLAEARAVADDVDGLMAKVRSLHQGLEAELALAVDVMMPSALLAAVLREFQRMFPTVFLRLHVEALGAVAALVLDHKAQLAIGGPEIVDRPELERIAIGAVELVPVAAPSHPLASTERVEPGMTRQHLQLVLTDRSPLTEGRDFSVASPRSWRLADLGAKHALLLEGIGWGYMPHHAVAADLAAGRLVALTMPEAPTVQYGLNALWRKDCPPGPATSWMLDAFQDALVRAAGDQHMPA